ncbi:hypothetical protein Tco_1019502 [Tanacetum coccineum]|uniref:Uncharacterized protein n=1 Tax=Tanacetum coccineum TaxID=301880 RepID=A0ABQ5FZ86_9ASTR
MTTLADKSLLSVRRHTKTTMLENIVLILGKSRMELSYVDSSLMEEMILLLRTSSNPRQKSHHYDGKVTVQPVHGRQTTYAAGTTRKYTPGASGSNTGKQRMETVTTPKGRVIFPSKEEIAFLADPRLLDTQTSHTVITHNVAYQADDWMPMTLMGDELSQPRLLSWPNLSWMAQMHSLRCRYIKKRLKIERNANVDKVFLDHEQYAEMNVPTTYQAPAENSLLEKTRDMRTFMNWYCQKLGKTELTQADLEGQAYEVVKLFYPDVVHLQFQMEECHKMLTDQIDWTNPEGDQVKIDINRPLPLSGPPGHVTIQTQFFFNHDLDYLRYGSKGSGQALSISNMKAARYHDFGLELLVPEHMWIDDVCTYDISASYGISHWWFNRQKFYIDRHTAESSRKVVRTYMCILSVVRIKAYSRYGLQLPERDHIAPKADHQILHDLPKRDSKTCILVTFEDLKCFLELCSPSVTINERSCGSMRFTKFSDGTLTNIMEALDYKVKEYKVNRLNPGMNTRFWTDKDVERSKEFIHAIERRLKTRRIFQNLECFVGGRVRDIDYRLLQRTE